MFNESKVSLCNIALGLIGVEEEVANIDNPSPENIWEQRCAKIYRRTLLLCLGLYMPSFAITPNPVRITRSTDGSFKIPADSLKILSVNEFCGDDIHEIGGEIQCDYPLHGDTIEVEYVRAVEQTGLWSPEFQSLFPYDLAVALAPYLSDSGKLQQAISLRDRKRAEVGGLNAQRVRLKRRYKGIYKSKWPFPIR